MHEATYSVHITVSTALGSRHSMVAGWGGREEVGQGRRVLSSKRSAITVHPGAFIKVRRRTQCEWGFTLQRE